MSTFGAIVFGAVLLQTEPNVDPNIVKPGWTPLLITGLLLVALALLFLSMRKQIRKIHVPDDDRPEADEPGTGAGQGSGGGEPAQPPADGPRARASHPEAP